ncbi:MAG TPA: hypothetical protein VFC00_29020 [Micromonosporaceae bacterium]|nr:hypothetical protein [Micromonosporaceae bacterium]
MALVRIQVIGLVAEVFSPYDPDRIEVIKTVPGRRWDKTGRFWEIPTAQVPALKLSLETNGDKVVIVGLVSDPPPRQRASDDSEVRRLRAEKQRLEQESGRLRQEVQRLRNEAAARGHSWAGQLLDQCPPALAEKVFKALTRVLHPDAGGDNDLQRDLNVARDRQGTWK